MYMMHNNTHTFICAHVQACVHVHTYMCMNMCICGECMCDSYRILQCIYFVYLFTSKFKIYKRERLLDGSKDFFYFLLRIQALKYLLNFMSKTILGKYFTLVISYLLPKRGGRFVSYGLIKHINLALNP